MDITYGTDITVTSPSLDDFDFNLSQEQVDTPVIPSVSEETQDEDRIVRVDTNATVDEEAQVSLEWLAGNLLENPVALSSTDEAVGTVDEDGYVTRVSDGEIGIIGSGPGLSKRIDVALERVGGQTVETFARFANATDDPPNGSANSHINAQVEGMLAAADIADGLNIFSFKDIPTETYVRNVNHWAYGVDLTAISPASSLNGVYRTNKQCTLITPKHYIFSYHYGTYPAGTIVYFVKTNGDVVPATVAGYHSTVGGLDCMVGLLSSAVSEDITPMKLLPTNWVDYLPSLSGGTLTSEGVGGGRYNQDDWLFAGEGSSLFPYTRFRSEASIDSAAIEEFYGGFATAAAGGVSGTVSGGYGPGDVRGGDSGGPGIIFVNGEAVLVTTWTSGYGGSGPDLSSNIANINAAIVAVDEADGNFGEHYEVGAVDLSEFTDYS